MSDRDNVIPSYRLHKQSGQAIVTLNGRDVLLGKHGSAHSREKYNRVIGEWISSGRQLLRPDQNTLTVTELVKLFWDYAKVYYRKPDGTPSSEQIKLKLVLVATARCACSTALFPRCRSALSRLRPYDRK